VTVTYAVDLTVADVGTIQLGEQLDSLTLTTGSYDGIELPQASQLSVSFYGTPAAFDTKLGVGWWLGKNIKLNITRSTGGTVFWEGFVTAANFLPVDARGTTFITTVQAAGYFSLLTNRFTTPSGYPAESLYQRTLKLNSDIRFDSWDIVTANLSWDIVPGTKAWNTWETYSNKLGFFYEYPSPIAYPLEAEPAGTNDCLSYLQDLTVGLDYWVYESPADTAFSNKIVGYSKVTLSTNSAKSFDFGANTLTNSLQSNSDLSTLINTMTVSNSTTSASYADYDSINDYGNRSYSMSSQLSVAGDLLTVASNKVLAYSAPAAALTRFTVDLDNFTSSDATYVPFTVYRPQNITLSNVPSVFGTETRYQIRGVSLSLTTQHAEAELAVVPYSVYAGATRWGTIATSVLWNNYATPVTTWAIL
jgi:hypothetical protein